MSTTGQPDRLGALSPLKRALLALEEMESKLDAMKRSQREPIAIVGIGCRFPGGAASPDAFWRVLRDGVNTVRAIPRERWDIDAYYDVKDPVCDIIMAGAELWSVATGWMPDLPDA